MDNNLRRVEVDRDKWIRGSAGSRQVSGLAVRTKERDQVGHCCIGFAALQFGCNFRSTLDELNMSLPVAYAHNLLPQEYIKFPPQWRALEQYRIIGIALDGTYMVCSVAKDNSDPGSVITDIYRINDDADIDDNMRELVLGHLGEMAGIDFHFYNGGTTANDDNS